MGEEKDFSDGEEKNRSNAVEENLNRRMGIEDLRNVVVVKNKGGCGNSTNFLKEDLI